MIDGVEFKELETHTDRRGFLREMWRASDPIARDGVRQVAHSRMFENVVKAWHRHPTQTDLYYIASGVARVGLYDERQDSPTYGAQMEVLLGDGQQARLLRIPPGVAHGIATVHAPVDLIYSVSEEWRPDGTIKTGASSTVPEFDWGGPPWG